jgi:pilus assembly protein CpaB
MNTRAFSLALIIAGIAVFMVYTYIDDQKTSLISRYGTDVTVVIAKNDIKELELLDDTKVAIKTVPKNFAAPGVFKEIKSIENTMATVPLMKGEQITRPRVTYPGAKTGLSRQVSMGKRAMAISIGDSNGASRLIKPGDRVDVVANVDYANGRADLRRTKTILQDVLVLSTGKSMTNSIPIYGVKTPRKITAMNAQVYEKYSSVTLELTSYEVQKLAFLIKYVGQPNLVLRNNNDKERIRIKSTDLFDVMGEDDRTDARKYFEQENKKRSR